MKTLLCTLMLAALGTVVAKADTVTITFDQPIQTGSAGETLMFFGTITNDTGSLVFLNGDGFTLAGSSLSINDQFFATVPISLAPGETSSDIELFDVIVSDPLLDAQGTYVNSYTLLGGADGDAQDNLGTGSFSVTTVPEPGSIYLLLAGVPAAFAPIAKRMRAGVAKRRR